MKILIKIKNITLGILALPFVLLMRMISPFIIVRIWTFELHRVGHALLQLNIHIHRQSSDEDGLRYFEVFCFKKDKIANYQVKKMMEKIVPICPFAFWADKINKRIPGWEKHVGVYLINGKLNCDLNAKVSLPLKFTVQEIEHGQTELIKLGIPSEKSYICFNARETSYLSTHQPEMNWEYHSYRNSDIDTYIPAIERLVSKGYFAIRMGRFVSKKIKTNHSRIIDYAANGGTDFLDMYLSAHCRFFVSGSDGLAFMSIIFGRPIVWINFVPFSSIYLVSKGHLLIPKKLWLIQEKRMLTFDEMLNTEISTYGRTEQYSKAGIEVINNTPEEIMDVSMEMEERLNGTWEETQEDKILQEEIQRILENTNIRKFYGRIGAKFLRQHKELIYGVSRQKENIVC